MNPYEFYEIPHSLHKNVNKYPILKMVPEEVLKKIKESTSTMILIRLSRESHR